MSVSTHVYVILRIQHEHIDSPFQLSHEPYNPNGTIYCFHCNAQLSFPSCVNLLITKSYFSYTAEFNVHMYCNMIILDYN